MTTLSKPLSYLTSKCVALYMNPNIRLGVITQYTDTPNPRSVFLDNAKGGIQEHVDIYGLPPRRKHDETENVQADNAEMASLRESIARMDRAKPGSRNNIERLNLKLEAYNMQRNNEPPPYRHYLQLTISTGKLVKIERVVYDKKFGLAKEYIEKIFFDNKNIQVEYLLIGGDKYLNEWEDGIGIQRGHPRHEPLLAYTPQADSVKPLLSIRSLEVGVLHVTGILTNALASLRPILSQVPLKELIAVPYKFTFLEDPIVNTSQFLHIDRPTPIRVLSNRPNYRIHIGTAFSLNDNDFTNLVNEWKKREIRIGTYYSMGEALPSDVKIFRRFRNIPGAKLGENDETR
ncbi:hypothetical protein CRE_12059 [Caenorhabditis remanei]|uniref:Uncharacterized protein n=1 Tax=Caenorhabditis remanei TaxID=31234 RepID=E3MPP3_CAERE|nr:hypothetical protein CRE_12059 [Caenorhabditis remanei]